MEKKITVSRKKAKILTVSRKKAKILTVNRKSHHPIDTLLVPPEPSDSRKYVCVRRLPDVWFEYFRVLKKALQMPCESCSGETAHKSFEGLF